MWYFEFWHVLKDVFFMDLGLAFVLLLGPAFLLNFLFPMVFF